MIASPVRQLGEIGAFEIADGDSCYRVFLVDQASAAPRFLAREARVRAADATFPRPTVFSPSATALQNARTSVSTRRTSVQEQPCCGQVNSTRSITLARLPWSG